MQLIKRTQLRIKPFVDVDITAAVSADSSTDKLFIALNGTDQEVLVVSMTPRQARGLVTDIVEGLISLNKS